MKSIYFYLILIAVISLARGQRCMEEGRESRRNNMVYVCRNGNEAPVACETAEGVRVAPNTEHRTPNFLMQCQTLSHNSYGLLPIACIKNGQVINFGSTVTDRGFWYTCKKEGEQVTLQPSGCIGDNGVRVPPNGILVKDQFLFRCKFTHTTIGLEPYGCVHEGNHYPAGQDAVGLNFWYTCNVIPRGQDVSIEFKVAGCVENGRKLNNGEVISRNGFAFQCEIAGQMARFGAIGCFDDNGQRHEFNQPFNEGSIYGYVMECRRDGDRLLKDLRGCHYQGQKLDRSCLRRFGNVLVKCAPLDGVRLRVEIVQNAGDNEFRQAINSGYRQC